jgi:hypothetical protein
VQTSKRLLDRWIGVPVGRGVGRGAETADQVGPSLWLS